MNRNKSLLIGSIMILPILIWVFVIFRYAVNIPWFDDFDPFPDFLRQWITNESAATRLKLVFQPNNEHRMVFGKLAALAYYLITGNLNFVFLQITGACFTLGTCYILWTSFRNSKINWWYFLPVPFLLFQFQYHLVFLWSICSLQHQPVIFFVTLTMFFLSKDRFTWAIVAGFCATFAMSNGIFVWAGGVAILFSRANFRKLGLWVFVGIIAVSLYFYGMSAQGNESSLDFLLKNPHLSILGFLAFLGGLFDLFPWLRIEYRSVLPVVFSTFVILFVITWLLSVFVPVTKQYWKFPKRIPVFVARFIPVGSNSRGLSAMLLGILVFLLSNALIIGLLRPRFGFFVMVVSNYKIYPAIFLSVAYLAFLSSSSGRSIQKTGYLGVLSISIIIWILSAFNYLPTISERHKYLLVNAYNQEHNAFGLGHVPFSKGAAYVDTLMTTMVKKGIYSYPPETASLVPEIEKVKNALPSKGSTRADIKDGVIQLKDSLGSYSYDYEDGKFPFIINGERLYLFKMDQNQYIGRNLLRQFDRGSGLEIPLSMLVPGSYKLGVVKIEGSSVTSNIVTTFNVP